MPPRSKPNIILISIDTMRADHLGCSGYTMATSPFIDSLASEGTRFAQCQSQAPWTLPSFASLFTGLSVVSHGAGTSANGVTVLDADLPSLPEILRENGYFTAGIANVSMLWPMFGFDRGFMTYFWQGALDKPMLNAGETVFLATSLINRARTQPDPFFLFVHFFDVHSPYKPPAPFDTLFLGVQAESDRNGVDNTAGTDNMAGTANAADTGNVAGTADVDENEKLIGLYDGEIAYVDEQLGELFRYVRQLGIADNTLIIIMSDHGEEFLDHGGVGHGQTLYQEILHVALIVSGPGIPVEVVDSPVGLYDVLPSVLAYLGIEAPPGLEGIDILTSPVPQGRMIPSSGFEGHSVSAPRTVAVLSDYEKILYDPETGTSACFHLRSDPEEHFPGNASDELIEAACSYWSTPPEAHPRELVDDHDLEALRSIGYLN